MVKNFLMNKNIFKSDEGKPGLISRIKRIMDCINEPAACSV